MPFIRGRYYVNPIAGGALEAAREAEEAAACSRSGGGADQQDDAMDAAEAAPISRIEIEVAQLVPAHSGHGTKGYVARLHRGDSVAPEDTRGAAAQPVERRVFYDQGELVNFLRDELAKNGTSR